MVSSDLVDPSDSDQLVLFNGAVPPSRPIMFGDVFQDVPCVRGGEPEAFVAVMTHPCSMRHGSRMRPRIVTAQVTISPPGKLDPSVWQTRFFDYFPLLGLGAQDPARPYVVRLGELHAAESAVLNLEQRVLALSDRGVAALLQRWIYQLSRDPVPIAELEELICPPMAEAELQEEWCEAALQSTPPEDLVVTLQRASEELQQFLGDPGGGGLRDELNGGELSGLARVRRDVRKERRDRYGS